MYNTVINVEIQLPSFRIRMLNLVISVIRQVDVNTCIFFFHFVTSNLAKKFFRDLIVVKKKRKREKSGIMKEMISRK